MAAALSALIPGMGQWFLGHRGKAVAFFSALLVMAIAFWPTRLPRLYEGLITLGIAGIVLFNLAVFDALFSRDRSTGARLSLGWIPLGLLIGYVGFNITFTLLLFGSGFRTFRFAASSMEPTINPGDKFVVDKRNYLHRSAARGDLVLIRRGDDVTIKRVIATAGDTIQGKDRLIILNNQAQEEPFIQHQFEAGTNPELDTFGPVTIPSGKYFVMGDNRDISLDSRMPGFGLIDATAIVGRPLYGYHISDKPLHWELK